VKAWQWRQANGAGATWVLPAADADLIGPARSPTAARQLCAHNPLSMRAHPQPVLIDKTPIEDPCAKLQPLEFEQVRAPAGAAVQSLMEEHHTWLEQPVESI